MREQTSIRIAEDGTETHESWLLVRANNVSGQTELFDSEITHQHFIRVSITRCSRRRDLNHDWLYNDQVLLEMDMSQAQWGAFVSSFGNGTGVPATLTWFDGVVPKAPFKGRLDESHREVREAGDKALAEIRDGYEALASAFERGAGKREMRNLLESLRHQLGNAPANMEFAAKSLTEHVENVTAKARADIEGMVLAAGGTLDRTLEAGSQPQLPEAPAPNRAERS